MYTRILVIIIHTYDICVDYHLMYYFSTLHFVWRMMSTDSSASTVITLIQSYQLISSLLNNEQSLKRINHRRSIL